MSGPSTAFLAFGSNLGDRERNIAEALANVAGFATIEAVSSLYETDPVPPDQPAYLNAVCRLSTRIEPGPLLQRLKTVERQIGRRGGKRWGPRPIDLDLLLYDAVTIEQPDFRLPHEGLAERSFVLVPLADVGAGVLHPVLAMTVSDIAQSTDRSGVRMWREVGWERRWL